MLELLHLSSGRDEHWNSSRAEHALSLSLSFPLPPASPPSDLLCSLSHSCRTLSLALASIFLTDLAAAWSEKKAADCFWILRCLVEKLWRHALCYQSTLARKKKWGWTKWLEVLNCELFQVMRDPMMGVQMLRRTRVSVKTLYCLQCHEWPVLKENHTICRVLHGNLKPPWRINCWKVTWMATWNVVT